MHIARGSSADRRTFDNVELELSMLPRRWDPIDVYDGDAPNPDPGEYDDLVVPLLDQLRQSSRPEALASALEQVLADDYGLPKVSNVDAFAATVAQWCVRSRTDTCRAPRVTQTGESLNYLDSTCYPNVSPHEAAFGLCAGQT